MATVYLIGKVASISWLSATHQMKEWSMEVKCDIVDVTNFGSAGFKENAAGLFFANISTAGPYKGAEGVNQGDAVTLTLATGGAGPSFAIIFRVETLKISTDVTGAAQFAVSGPSTGTFTLTGI